MARGGCQITTATSRIDARLETRLGRHLERAAWAPNGSPRRRAAALHERRRSPGAPQAMGRVARCARASAWRTSPRSSSKAP